MIQTMETRALSKMPAKSLLTTESLSKVLEALEVDIEDRMSWAKETLDPKNSQFIEMISKLEELSDDLAVAAEKIGRLENNINQEAGLLSTVSEINERVLDESSRMGLTKRSIAFLQKIVAVQRLFGDFDDLMHQSRLDDASEAIAECEIILNSDLGIVTGRGCNDNIYQINETVVRDRLNIVDGLKIECCHKRSQLIVRLNQEIKNFIFIDTRAITVHKMSTINETVQLEHVFYAMKKFAILETSIFDLAKKVNNLIRLLFTAALNLNSNLQIVTHVSQSFDDRSITWEWREASRTTQIENSPKEPCPNDLYPPELCPTPVTNILQSPINDMCGYPSNLETEDGGNSGDRCFETLCPVLETLIEFLRFNIFHSCSAEYMKLFGSHFCWHLYRQFKTRIPIPTARVKQHVNKLELKLKQSHMSVEDSTLREYINCNSQKRFSEYRFQVLDAVRQLTLSTDATTVAINDKDEQFSFSNRLVGVCVSSNDIVDDSLDEIICEKGKNEKIQNNPMEKIDKTNIFDRICGDEFDDSNILRRISEKNKNELDLAKLLNDEEDDFKLPGWNDTDMNNLLTDISVGDKVGVKKKNEKIGERKEIANNRHGYCSLPICNVSKSTHRIIGIIRSLLLKLYDIDDTDKTDIVKDENIQDYHIDPDNRDSSYYERIYMLIRQCVLIFLLLRVKAHKDVLMSDPRSSALYYCDCLYFLHCITVMKLLLSKNTENNTNPNHENKTNSNHENGVGASDENASKLNIEKMKQSDKSFTFDPSLLDLVVYFRSAQRCVFLSVINLQRDKIDNLMSQIKKKFYIVSQGSAYAEVEMCFTGCVHNLSILATMWKHVLPIRIYLQSLGLLIDYFLQSILSMLFRNYTSFASSSDIQSFNLILKSVDDRLKASVISDIDYNVQIVNYVSCWDTYEIVIELINADLNCFLLRRARMKEVLSPDEIQAVLSLCSGLGVTPKEALRML